MGRIRTPLVILGFLFLPVFPAFGDPVTAARALVVRIVPDYADSFVVEFIPKDNGYDVFEIESVGDKITLRGSSGVAIASALNWYLKHYCHSCVSWRGTQVNIPDPLPRVEPKVRHVTPFQWRYCFNYCCFSYSMAWWDWPEWERIIDWMALNGINMPLSVTGQEAVWQQVGRNFGLSDDEMNQFFVGTGYLPFGWMGCIDGWGGPLSQSWIDRHAELERRILERERELGMKPVLQGFTGHVPAALKSKFPDSKFQQLPSWCGFPGTMFVDPQDPLFVTVGKAFVEEQARQFGTDHLYASDTFIEMSPPSNDPAFLNAMGQAVFEAMRSGDPDAVWVMQGWLFVNNPNFWQPPQARALLGSVPDDRLIMLDLYCESQPAWRLTESFYGKPWIWCIIQDFGDVVSLHGGLPQIADGLVSALNDPRRGKLCGAGFIMEGLGYNPVVQDLVSEIFWDPREKDLPAWISNYTHERYGKRVPQAERAWSGLLQTAYRCPGRTGSVVCARPALGSKGGWAEMKGPYDWNRLMEAWGALMSCRRELRDVDMYQYDVIHLARQVLGELAARYHARTLAAYAAKDLGRFDKAVKDYLQLVDDMDRLLSARPEFLLGRWIEDAKRWGATEDEKRLLEWNARNQITLWGPSDSVLHDYAQKQWAGLIRGFYRPRWERFLGALREAMVKEAEFDRAAFEHDIQQWEDAWTHQTEPYPAAPSGDPLALAQELWKKYRGETDSPKISSLTTGKPTSCSASLPPYPANLANDGRKGDTNQYWATDVTSDPAAWWQVDLGKPARVGRVDVVFYYGDERTYTFMIETSLDGKTWDLVADYRDKPQPATSEGTECRFTPRKTRFIRITVTGNSANTGRHLVEVMAYPK